MKSNELRIGNNVLLTDINEICTITSISNNYIGYDSQTRTGKAVFECFKPIQLTEEWLLKLGYELSQGHYIISGHLIWTCNDLLMCNKNGIVLKHVHQLQNLYFALTNNEL